MGRNLPLHVCVSRDSGPQCGWIGMIEHEQAARKGIPTHVHRDQNGRWVATVWGSEALCTWAVASEAKEKP